MIKKQSFSKKEFDMAEALKDSLTSLLSEIRSAGDQRELNLQITYDTEMSKIKYNVAYRDGEPSVEAEDIGRCPAHAKYLGDQLFEELFGRGTADRPSFQSITFGYRKRKILPGKMVLIEINKGRSPFDQENLTCGLSPTGFVSLLGRLDEEGLNYTTESIEDMLKNVVPAVREALSQYHKTLDDRSQVVGL